MFNWHAVLIFKEYILIIFHALLQSIFIWRILIFLITNISLESKLLNEKSRLSIAKAWALKLFRYRKNLTKSQEVKEWRNPIVI